MSVISTNRTFGAARMASASKRPAPDAVKAGLEALIVLAATATAMVALRVIEAEGLHPLFNRADPVLAAATAGLAAIVALLCAVNSRLGVAPGMWVVTCAWAYYSLVVMPVSVIVEVPGTGPIIPGIAAAAGSVFISLLALGLLKDAPPWLAGRRAVRGVWAQAVLIAIVASAVYAAVHFDARATAAVLLEVGGLFACVYIARGLRDREPVWRRMGYGAALIVAAHTLLHTGASTEFAVVRFVGFLVLLVALCLHTRGVVSEHRAARAEAASAAAAMERSAAEHRHEMRNVLVTLAGVTTLMTPRPGAEVAVGDGAISAMIDGELARLRDLLDGAAPNRTNDTAAVDVVLARLVTLRRCSGVQISLDCPPGMVAALPTALLTQVVTNLLENCARHAPGAAIHVGAYREAGMCVVEVTDAGPGLDPAASTVGDGLGLALSSRLLESVGGTLQLRAGTRFATGTTVLLHLPPDVDSPRGFAAAPVQEKATI